MNYATKFDNEKMSRAQGIALPISLKQSVEICSFIRNKKYKVAVMQLKNAAQLKEPVPYTRFNRGGTGHRKGMASGRYPVKAATHILQLIKSAYANANQKGLDVNNLIIKAAVAKQGPKTPHYGRKRGTTAKRTHVEVVLMQIAAKKPSKAAVKPKAEAKAQAKTEKAETKADKK